MEKIPYLKPDIKNETLNVNVSNMMDALHLAMVEIHNTDNSKFGRTYEKDCKDILGMTDDNIELFSYRHQLPTELIIPVTFTNREEDDGFPLVDMEVKGFKYIDNSGRGDIIING